MAKKRVHCPECGHRHSITIGGGRAPGVRYVRTTKNQFRTAIDVPGEVIENDKYWTLGDQFLGAALVGLFSGTMAGYFVSLPWHVDDTLVAAQIIMGGAVSGPPVACFLLYKERAWNLGKALPAAVGQYLALSKGATPVDGMPLTVDHRYRDGNTEAGRTINYFGQLPVAVEAFNGWAQDVLRGDSLAIGRQTGPGKRFHRNEYDQLLSLLRRGGIVTDAGSNKGNQLTGVGRRTLRGHLESCGIIPPSPADEEDFFGARLAEVNKAVDETPLPHRSGERADG